MTLIDRPTAPTTAATTATPIASPTGTPTGTPTATPTCAPRGSVGADVCALDDLPVDRGVCALVDGTAVALFRCWPDDELYGLANVDPYSGASVLSRGIVGSVGETPVVASPLFKQRFDLRTGTAVDDPDVRVPTFAVHVVDGRVHVDPVPRPDPSPRSAPPAP